ncbi:PspA-associated protein PspAA [Streptacidiphilus carbonis]|jgi:hypothetical protein|uniref:PspA-associated protein PspAA n=1 Tax=Streptacidiphilus carbonis TaxID=105422 RepID=UPI0005A99842|nr:hypothetical protein [Streptacidiphilus carbonis]
MIVRIMGEGQFEVPDSLVDRLNELDNAVLAALDSADRADFKVSLAALLAAVRAAGTPVADDVLLPSDATLPFEDATVDQVKALLHDDGLIPG